MSTDLIYLLATTGLVPLHIVLQAVLANLHYKPQELLGPRDDFEITNPRLGRAKRAMTNLLESLAVFVPVVLVIEVTGQNSATTAIAAAVFFWARVIYLPAYIMNPPFVRSLVWGVGFVALLILFLQALPG